MSCGNLRRTPAPAGGGNNDLVGGTKEPKMRKLPNFCTVLLDRKLGSAQTLRRFEGPDVFKEVPSSWKWGPLLSNALLAAVGMVNQASTVKERGGFKLLKKAVSTNHTGDYPFSQTSAAPARRLRSVAVGFQCREAANKSKTGD